MEIRPEMGCKLNFTNIKQRNSITFREITKIKYKITYENIAKYTIKTLNLIVTHFYFFIFFQANQ